MVQVYDVLGGLVAAAMELVGQRAAQSRFERVLAAEAPWSIPQT
jgi:hypothetical protein